ncbi:MAG: riboflavin biosynthesis protein RibF [Candidatus Omnitrophica bacterium]|nr:riboflavin biosynthesis protein RibF [Candidatus Omnitrophota bacterium]
MIILRRIPARPVRWKNPVAAIGIFDGVHRGHQAILRRAVVRARALGGTPMAITFNPHPLTVLNPSLVPPMLLSIEQRIRAFEQCGIRAALVIPFTRVFSRWTPDQFVRRLLVGTLRVREVVVGHDFGFGVRRSGSIETLKEAGRQFGFKVHAVAPVRIGRQRIASHQIRLAIRKGDLVRAAKELGRPVTVVGVNIPGFGRGRRMGFPTANLRIGAGVLPPVGVYAVTARVSSSRKRGSDSRFRGNDNLQGMANIGYRPTFSVRHRFNFCKDAEVSDTAILEVHLFGVRRQLYGQALEVVFHKRLRPERRFASAEALTRQLCADARRAKRFFALQGKARVI